MHHRAKWAVVGGGCCRMPNGDVDQRKKQEDSQAHHNDRLQSAYLWTAIDTCVCQRLLQRNILNR
jgi:hypothetical protein